MDSTIDPRQQQNGLNVHQTNTLVCLWVLFSVSSVVMILRLISQCGIMRIIRADDILMIVAWMLQAARTITSTIAIHWGLGRHDWQLPNRHAFRNVIKFEMYSMIFGVLCGTFARLSFAVFLLYFIQRVSHHRKYLIWVIIVLQAVTNVTCLAIVLAQCAPSVKGAWDAGLCRVSMSVMAVQYAQAAINAASNLCLTFIAVGLVLQIRASKYTKASLGIPLSLSLIATVAEIVDAVEVSQTRNQGSDFSYRFNLWNYWYAIENAVIIITASLPKTRPVALVTFQRLKRCPFWKKLISTCPSKCFTRSHDRNTTTRLAFLHGRHIQGADYHVGSSILRRLKPKPCSNSSYNKETKPTFSHSNQCPVQSHDAKRHCHHFSNTSGATKLSLGSRPTTTRTASGFDSIDLTSLSDQQLASDFVPLSSSRLKCQTVITAGNQPQASTFTPASTSASMSFPMPQAPPSAVTPTASLSPPNGSGRSSRNSTRNGDGFTTTNSSFIFLPLTNNNASSSSTRGKSRGRRHHHRNDTPSGPFPILQTNHFTIEYEDENTASACDDDSINQQPHHLGLVWADDIGQSAEMGRTRTRYNEDDAEALQLHDVGCILSESSSRGNQS